MSKLSKREKFLLYILLYITIFAIGLSALVLPVRSLYEAQKETLAVVRQEKQLMQAETELLAVRKETLNAQKKKTEAMKAQFSPMLENFEVEKMLTLLCAKNALKVEVFTISSVISEEEENQPNEEVMDTGNITTLHLSIVVNGAEQNMVSLTTELGNMVGMRVSKLDMCEGVGTIDVEVHMLTEV